MAPKAQILDIVNLLTTSSKGFGVGKSNTAKTVKKEFKNLLKNLTSKNKQKDKKLTSSILKEQVPVILPFSLSEVKKVLERSERIAGGNIPKQTTVKIETPKNGIDLTTKQLAIATVAGKTNVGGKKNIKNVYSPGKNKLVKPVINVKTLKKTDTGVINNVVSANNVVPVKNSPLIATSGLGIKINEGRDLKITTKQPGLSKVEKKGSHNSTALSLAKKEVLHTEQKIVSIEPLKKRVVIKTEKKKLIGQLQNTSKAVNNSADVEKLNIAPKVKPEQNKNTKLVTVKESGSIKESYSIAKSSNAKSDPLLSKIEKSAARLIAENLPKPALITSKEPDSKIKHKTSIVSKNLSSLTIIEKPSTHENILTLESQSGEVPKLEQTHSKLVRGMRNSVIHSMQPVSVSSIGKKIKVLQSSAKRVISESEKREAPTLRIFKGTKSRKLDKQVVNHKSVEKSYNNLLDFSDNRSNTLIDSDTKSLFNAQMEISREDITLSKLKTTFVRSGELIDQSKLQDNNLMKFTIKEIDKELSQIQLRVRPRGLGDIKIDLQQEGNVLTAKFLVETPEIAKLLKDALPELKDTLSQQGINLEDSDISSRKEEFAHQFNGKKEGNFGGKRQGNNTSGNPELNQNVDVPLELLSQKQTLIHRPNSTIEYLA